MYCRSRAAKRCPPALRRPAGHRGRLAGRRERNGGLRHLHARRLCDLAELLLLALALLLLALVDFLLRVAARALRGLHVAEAHLVVVRVRVRVFVVLRDVLELLLAHFAVEGPEHARELGLHRDAARDGFSTLR